MQGFRLGAILAAGLCAAVLSCNAILGSGFDSLADAGADATPQPGDAEVDARPEAGGDATVADAGMDAADSGNDVTVADSGVDAQPEAGADATKDAIASETSEDAPPDANVDTGVAEVCIDAGLCCPARPPGVDAGSLTTGLVAYWEMEGNGNDSAGYDNTLASAAPVDDASLPPAYNCGKFGLGLHPGTMTSLSAGLYRGAPVVGPGGTLDWNADFTMAAWVNIALAGLSSGTGMVNNFLVDGPLVAGQSNGHWGGHYGASAPSDLDDGAAAIDTSQAGTMVGVWHLLVFYHVAGDAGQGYELFITVDNDNPAAPVAMNDAGFGATNIWIGRSRGGYAVQGLVDEVAIWNRVLSAAEISTLYNGGSGVPLR